MFSRESNQKFGYRSVAAGAIFASCAIGALMFSNQTTQPQAEEALINASENTYNKPFETIVQEKLSELARKKRMSRADVCENLRHDHKTHAPQDAYLNIESVLHGYNVFKGSPFAKHDQGYSASRLFEVDWTHSIKDSFGKHRPKDVNVTKMNKCSTKIHTSAAYDEAVLQKEYMSNFDGGLGGKNAFQAAFKGSNEFKHAAETLKKGHKTEAISTAKCITEKFSLKRVVPPCMSYELSEFIHVLLDEPHDDSLLTEFFDTFGTHAVMGVEMGDKFTSKSLVNTKFYGIMRKEHGKFDYDK
jgi:hypothetical protein